MTWVTLWLGLFLLTISAVHTLTIILVLVCGQDLELKRWNIFQKNYFEWEPSIWYTTHVNFKYYYYLDEHTFAGEFVVKKSYPTHDSGMESWGMPAGFSNGAYRIRVWNVLPGHAIPLLPDHNPFWATLPFWLSSMVFFLIYTFLKRVLGIAENDTDHSLSVP